MKKLTVLFVGLCFFGCARKTSAPSFGIEKKCLEGHIYFIVTYYGHGKLALKVDDNGKPIKCRAGEEK